ncbi:hypothetical protein M885DRAFT_615451 [Pelagophyceae sp. CCMP2097]|nr:hypothetical protein M885DRAFT_615451 [Pelagophyceae sp. CCMP2097]
MADAPRKRKLPPVGYACKACGEPGHWIHECKEFKPSDFKAKKAKPSADGDGSKPPPAQPVSAAAADDMVHCSCGKRCRKRRCFVPGVGPSSLWVCGHKKGKCRFSKPTDGSAAAVAEPEEKKKKDEGVVNGRYVQRAAKRNAARKLFVSGIPFGADAAGKLAAFFGEHGVEGLSRVAPLKSGQGSGRFSGQAYVEFELVEQAVAALALSGKKLEDRWLEITKVKPERAPQKAGSGSEESSDEESSDEESSDEADDEPETY